MPILAITLPKPLREFVETQVSEGGYDTPSAYIAELLDQVRKEKAKEKLENMVLEGVNSGPPIEANDAYWEAKQRRLEQRFRTR